MTFYRNARFGLLLALGVDLSAVQAQQGAAAEPAPSIDTTPSADTSPETIPVSPRADEPPPPQRAASSSRLIEEIIVTAQKREENLQDVPISINAFSADTLDARGIADPKDLPLATPGLTVGSQAGFTVTYLRGVGSDGFLLADPSVALYIDGIYFPFAHGQAQNFGAIERVEVLKGPQGTLFGRNAVGGAISVVTKAPSFDAPEVSLQASYSRFNNLQTRAHVNVPLADNLAFSVSGIYGNEDDYRDATSAGKPLPGEVTKGARVKLRWAPIESLDLTAAALKLEQIGAGTLFATNSDPSPLFTPLITQQDGGQGDVDTLTFIDLENTVYYGQGVLNTDWFDVKVLASDQSIHDLSQYDFDGSQTPIVSFIGFFFADVKTAELQILSNATSWGADKFKWIAGYYHFDGRQGLDVNFAAAGSVLNQLNGILAPVLSPLGIPPLVPGQLLDATGTLQTDSNSIYAQGTYDFTDWLDLTLGVRAQEEKRTIVQSGGALAVLPVGEPVPYTDFRGQHDTTRSLSPKVSLDLRPWDGGLVYLSYQQAVKSSTFNVVNFLHFTSPEPVKKEELTAYELGVKTKLLDNTTTVSAAAFYYDIKNIQVQFISLLAGGAVTFENAPAAEVKGVDFDLTSEIFPSLLDGLVFTAGGAYVDAKFTDFPDGQGFNDTTGVYSAHNDYSGKRIPRSPKFSGTVGLSQTIAIPGGPLEIGADYYYNSGFYYLAQNTDFNQENAYGVLGARISYLYEAWNLRATVFGKNITDTRYNYSRFTNDFGGLDSVAPPAVYGVRLNWDF